MGILDHQMTFAAESTFNVAVARTRAFEYESEGIGDDIRRTEGDPLRVGSPYQRNDRFTPYYGGANGTVQFAVMTKGFGFFLPYMLGSVGTTGPAETVAYTHTGTTGTLMGKSFCMQLNRPFHPSGTNQPFTYTGGKIAEWTMQNSVDGNLMLDMGLDFAACTTATALDTPAYPSAMDNFTWAGGKVTIAGADYDVTEVAIQNNNGLDVDRRQIRQNTDKKEQTSARREGSVSLQADFDSLTQRNRAVATTRTGALASLVATWRGPSLLGTTIYPSITVTIPAVRFDEWDGSSSGPEGITQSFGGAIRYDGSASAISIAYVSADTTP